jgi:tetratricopeptide (TPR) repeat protein
VKPSILIIALSFLALVPQARADTAAQAYARGASLEKARQYARAGAEYKTALKLDTRYAWAWRGLGDCYYGLGYRTQAIQSWDRYLAAFPSDAGMKKFVDGLRGSAPSGSQASSDEGVYMIHGWPPLKEEGAGHNFYVCDAEIEYPSKDQLVKMNASLVTGPSVVLRRLKMGKTYRLYMSTVRHGSESDPAFQDTFTPMAANLLPSGVR